MTGYTMVGNTIVVHTGSFTPQNLDLPRRVGYGPAVFSTCTALAPLVSHVADVNGYYTALGVGWRASKKELREAYQRLDGQSSEYLTYVLHLLLNSEFRQRYDRMQLGSIYIDKYKLEAFNRLICRKMARSSAEAREQFKDDMSARIEAITERVEKVQESLDSTPSDMQDETASPDTGYHYSHYRLRSTAGDITLLPEWQQLVIDSCRKQGIEVSIALGFHNKSMVPWLVERVGYHTVIFFHEDRQPDAIFADDAVRYISQQQRKSAA